MTRKKQTKFQFGLTELVILGSFLATMHFLLTTIRLVKDIQWQMLGAPATFSAIFAVALGVVAWTRTRSTKKRYLLVSFVTTIVVGYLVWFFGLTYAKVYIPSTVDSIPLNEGICEGPEMSDPPIDC